MAKASKLREKPVRFPDTRVEGWSAALTQYRASVAQLPSESAKSHRFTAFVQQVLDVHPEFIDSYCAGIEHYLKTKQKDMVLKGKADNLFGNVILEFERDLSATLDEAEEQLRRYTAILWSKEKPDSRRRYLCVAGDGLEFRTYTPKLQQPAATAVTPEMVTLVPLEQLDWRTATAEDVFYWLDRHFLRKERLHPTSEEIVRDFGPKSHAFQIATERLHSVWGDVKGRGSFAVIYESWEKYLRVVYGSEVGGEELFMRHTYLATLAKLMSWMRIADVRRLPEKSQIVQILDGTLFREHVQNFIEEDFFSWLARGAAVGPAVAVARWLFSLLQNYNLRELSEDVLKVLYQELVDPEARHDLGEYYTPDWLAGRMVRKLMDEKPLGSFLDPTCGSGTFVYQVIRAKKARMPHTAKTLRHVLESVCGADVHPLAVIISKTNYILALGDLLEKRTGAVTIPIYLANTVKLPELVTERKFTTTKVGGITIQLYPGYGVELDDVPVRIPEAVIENAEVFDRAVELASQYAQEHRSVEATLDSFARYLNAQRFEVALDEGTVHSLYAVADALTHLIQKDRDTIWAFVLKNVYKPLFFKKRFDFVVGNPPWISYRFFDPVYQKYLKSQIVGMYHLLEGKGHLITHLEIASLFIVHSADWYLKHGGTIAFVMPRSLFTADQHDSIRRRTFTLRVSAGDGLFWREIWDCDQVEPLFKVPSCVVMADKRDWTGMKYPVAAQVLSGELPRKNASLAEADSALDVKDTRLSVQTRGKRSYWASEGHGGRAAASYYRSEFSQGATIVPRSFWFVQVKPSSLGFDPRLPPLETSDRAREQAKDAYESVRIEGPVESEFLYTTVLSTDLLPFGTLRRRLMVLPIRPEHDHYALLAPDKLEAEGFVHTAKWLRTVEKEWAARRSAKAGNSTSLAWLDYRHKLTSQDPRRTHLVVYNTSGTFPAVAVLDNQPYDFPSDGQSIKIRGTIVECVTYYYATHNRAEALYLAALLNSPCVNTMVRPMMARGLWGPRHIHKKILELPIPQYDAAQTAHASLAQLGGKCHRKVEDWLKNDGPGHIKSIGRLRSDVRKLLASELAEIDDLVKKVLGQ